MEENNMYKQEGMFQINNKQKKSLNKTKWDLRPSFSQ